MKQTGFQVDDGVGVVGGVLLGCVVAVVGGVLLGGTVVETVVVGALLLGGGDAPVLFSPQNSAV